MLVNNINSNRVLVTGVDSYLHLLPICIPNTEHLMGHVIDSRYLEGPEQEFYEGFFLVDFLPTSENLCEWIADGVRIKMHRLGIRLNRVEWNETPKSRSSYFV